MRTQLPDADALGESIGSADACALVLLPFEQPVASATTHTNVAAAGIAGGSRDFIMVRTYRAPVPCACAARPAHGMHVHWAHASRRALVTLCVITLVACGSNSSSRNTTQSAGEGMATAAPSSLAARAQTADASKSANLPIYSGATKQAMPAGFNTAMSSCGRKIAVVSTYKVDADAQTVANWYKSRLPGGSVINMMHDSESSAADDTNIRREKHRRRQDRNWFRNVRSTADSGVHCFGTTGDRHRCRRETGCGG